MFMKGKAALLPRLQGPCLWTLGTSPQAAFWDPKGQAWSTEGMGAVSSSGDAGGVTFVSKTIGLFCCGFRAHRAVALPGLARAPHWRAVLEQKPWWRYRQVRLLYSCSTVCLLNESHLQNDKHCACLLCMFDCVILCHLVYQVYLLKQKMHGIRCLPKHQSNVLLVLV